jgi:hypothetical protein
MHFLVIICFVLLEELTRYIKMEKIGLVEKGHGAMCVEDCNSVHKSHSNVAMETIMASI